MKFRKFKRAECSKHGTKSLLNYGGKIVCGDCNATSDFVSIIEEDFVKADEVAKKIEHYINGHSLKNITELQELIGQLRTSKGRA